MTEYGPEYPKLEAAMKKHDSDAVYRELEGIVKHEGSVYTMGNRAPDGSISLQVSDMQGEPYPFMLTSPEHFVSIPGVSLIALKSIRQLLDTLFADDSTLGGLAINAYTDGFFMPKYGIADIIKRSRQGTWKAGIPDNYSQCDLMSKPDLLQFAVETLCENCMESRGLRPYDTKNLDSDTVLLLAKRGSEDVQIAVQAAVAPSIPELNNSLVQKLRASGANECYYASLSFGSADEQRFYAKLALRGDGYHCRFTGLEKV